MQREISRACRTIAVAALAGASSGPASRKRNNQRPAAIGDLMTAFVQPRHIKLGLGRREQNWPYAAYELHQLRETFADLAEILPKYRDLSIPDMITSTGKEPLAALDRAIQAKDNNQLTETYGATDSVVQRLPPELRPPGDRDPAPDGSRLGTVGL